MSTLLRSILVWAFGTAIARLAAALGIGLLTFNGLNTLVGNMLSYLQASIGGLSAELSSILAIAGVFEGMSVGASAFVAVASIKSAKVFLGVQ